MDEDYEVSQPQETAADNAPQEASPSGAADTTPAQPSIRVKYNHEERELPYDEAVSYAQKGMNYDKLSSQYQRLLQEIQQSGSEEGEDIEPSEASADSGSEDEDQGYDHSSNESEAGSEGSVDAGSQSSRDFGSEYAAMIWSELAEGRAAKAKLAAIERDSSIRSRMGCDIKRLKAVFPDADPKDLPEIVLNLMRNGESLVGAYALYNAAGKSVTKDAESRNDFNKARSTGGAFNDGGDTAIDEESLNAMSVDDIKKNFKQLMKNFKRN